MTRIEPAELPDEVPFHNDLVRVTYRNPEMHRGFASLSGRVHSASHVPDRTRELVVLAVAAHLGATFEWEQHAPAARRAGVTEAEIDGLSIGDLSVLDGADRAAVTYALAVEDRTVDDGAWAAARAHHSDVELLDLTLLTGFYGLASRLVLAVDIPSGGESGSP
ncbi:MAG: carboxymuconolactone decarboxylase family protein [Ilumatobacteraceae bacterium]